MDNDKHTIVSGEYTYCWPEWHWRHQGNLPGHFNLWLIMGGVGVLRTDEGAFQLSAGDCFLIDLGKPCEGAHNPKHPLVVPWIIFIPPSGASLQKFHRKITSASLLESLMVQSINENSNPQGDKHWAAEWLKMALRLVETEDNTAAKAYMAGRQYETIERIRQSIINNPGQFRSVEGLARECHWSIGHFTRRFHQQVGLDPRAFITKARVDRARSLLRMSSHPVGEIAQMLGYCDIFHFSRQFKAETGTSPSEYRNL